MSKQAEFFGDENETKVKKNKKIAKTAVRDTEDEAPRKKRKYTRRAHTDTKTDLIQVSIPAGCAFQVGALVGEWLMANPTTL